MSAKLQADPGSFTGRIPALWIVLSWGTMVHGQQEQGTDPRLRLHFDFRSIQDGRVTDLSSRGHDGELEGLDGALPNAVDTPYGKALKLEKGKGQGVRVGFARDLACTNGLTLMAWIRPDFVRGHLAVVANKGDTVPNRPASGYRLSVNWSRIMLDLGFGDAQGVRLISPEWTLHAGYWAHVAATFDGREMILYINAAEVARNSLDEPRALAVNRRSFTLGKYFWNNAYPFTGLLADVRILAGALTEDEILAVAGRFLD